jgi:hypothetical protein
MAEVITSATSQVDPRAAMMYPLVKVMCKSYTALSAHHLIDYNVDDE